MATYGIGVQNRYSAFLDEEDGVAAAALTNTNQTPAAQAKGAMHAATKQKSVGPAPNKSMAGQKLRVGAKTEKGDSTANDQRQRIGDKRQRQQQYGANNHVQAANGKHGASAGARPGNSNQENTANNYNNRSLRTQSNYHQSNASQTMNHNSPSKENNNNSNQSPGKFARNANGPTGFSINSNQRPHQGGHHQQRRPYVSNSDDRKVDGTNIDNSPGANTQSVEEEKRRRQQKRATDLKYKDPEKREARRQQQQQQSTDQSSSAAGAAAGNQAYQDRAVAGNKNRRRLSGGDAANQDEQATGARGLRGTTTGARGRGRRGDLGMGAPDNEGEKRDGQSQTSRGPRPAIAGTGERPQRNRNEFGSGLRGRGGATRAEEQGGRLRRDSDRQKPIPNFSDKLDFPSLVS